MNRRGFLSMLGMGAAALTLDSERALWVPGAKLISIPKPQITTARFKIGDTILFRVPRTFIAPDRILWPMNIADHIEAITVRDEASVRLANQNFDEFERRVRGTLLRRVHGITYETN